MQTIVYCSTQRLYGHEDSLSQSLPVTTGIFFSQQNTEIVSDNGAIKITLDNQCSLLKYLKLKVGLAVVCRFSLLCELGRSLPVTRGGNFYLSGNLFESVDREWGYQNLVTMLYNGGHL